MTRDRATEADGPALTLKQAIDLYGAETAILRHLNRNEVLRWLRNNRETGHPISAIVTATELSRPTVNVALADLAERGLITDSVTPTTSPRGGRPARLYQFNARSGIVAAVTLARHEITVVIADRGEATLSEARRTFENLNHEPDPIACVGREVKTAISDLDLGVDQLEVVAIAVRGVVGQDGVIQVSGDLPTFAGPKAHKKLLRQFPCAVLIENDANVATLAEHRALSGPDDVVGLLIGDAVGCGLILNGELYRGSHGGAGEFFADEKRGWVATNQAIRDYVDQRGMTYADFYATAAKSPGRPRSLVTKYASDIATLARGLLVLDPPVIVIGGEIVHAGDVFIEPLREKLMPNLYSDTRIVYSDLGAECLRSGALRLAFDWVEAQLFKV